LGFGFKDGGRTGRDRDLALTGCTLAFDDRSVVHRVETHTHLAIRRVQQVEREGVELASRELGFGQPGGAEDESAFIPRERLRAPAENGAGA